MPQHLCPGLCAEPWAYPAAVSQLSIELGQLCGTVPVGCDTPRVTSTRGFLKAAPQGPSLTGGSSDASLASQAAKVTCVTSAVLITILAGIPNPEQLSTCGWLPLGRLQGVLAASCVHHLSCQVPLQEDEPQMASLSSAFHFYRL